MMKSGEVSDPVPSDLIFEILSRLPAKSVARFRCVSKPWESMLRNYSPRLLFALKRREHYEWSVFSSQPQLHHEKFSPTLTADFNMKFSWPLWPDFRGLTSGLIFFSSMRLKKPTENTSQKDKEWEKYTYETPVICNAITGQYAILPELRRYRKARCFLGFDPIDKRFKMLFMGYPYSPDNGKHRIMTLGTGEFNWRKICCSMQHEPLGEGICINGVLYYLGDHAQDDVSFLVVCFDVRSETFKFINAVCEYGKLVNYKGKLAGINCEAGGDGALKLTIWVLQDFLFFGFEKHVWNKYIYTLRDENIVTNVDYVVGGMTATGDIVLSSKFISKPFYVFYFNPERNTLRSVEIQVPEEYNQEFYGHGVSAIVDHVDDLIVNNPKLYESSPVDEDLNNIKEKPNPEENVPCSSFISDEEDGYQFTSEEEEEEEEEAEEEQEEQEEDDYI